MASKVLSNKGYSIVESQASFYILVKVTPKFKDVNSCVKLLEQQQIIVNYGSNYGNQFLDYIRICLILPIDQLELVLLKF